MVLWLRWRRSRRPKSFVSREAKNRNWICGMLVKELNMLLFRVTTVSRKNWKRFNLRNVWMVRRYGKMSAGHVKPWVTATKVMIQPSNCFESMWSSTVSYRHQLYLIASTLSPKAQSTLCFSSAIVQTSSKIALLPSSMLPPDYVVQLDPKGANTTLEVTVVL